MIIGEGREEPKEARGRTTPPTDEGKRPIYGRNLLYDTVEHRTDEGAPNPNLLTKQNVIQGTNLRKTVHLEYYDKDVIVRPLTDGELTEVFRVVGNVPLNEEGLPDLSLVDISKNLEALRLVTSMGLVEPMMSIEEVGEMRFGTPGFLAKTILELSGLSESAGDGIKKFRDDA